MRVKFTFFAILCLLAASATAQSSGFVDRLQQRNIRIWNATNINTPMPEFSPAIYLNGLVFVSRRKQGPINWDTGKTYYELFYAERDANGIPSKRINFSPRINNSWLNEGPVSFNRTGDLMFFSQDNSAGGVSKADEKGIVWMKIYQAAKGDFDWEGIKELPFNSDQYSCMHPCLSPDGSTLYFSSNRPGGYGGMDLYVVKRQENGAWMDPINLGPEINTNKNEVFPFIHTSGVLFFTSDGHDGFGGLDLFMIDISGKRWGNVLNMGEPFNSKDDDLSLIVNSDGTRGYFASSRPGGAGDDDIYIFETPEGLPGAAPANQPTAMMTVIDGTTRETIAGAAIRILESNEDGYLGNDKLYDLELEANAEDSKEMVLRMVRKHEDSLGPPQYFTGQGGQVFLPLKPEKHYLIIVSKPGYESGEVELSTEQIKAGQPFSIELTSRNCLRFEGKVSNGRNGKGVPNARVHIYNRESGEEEWLQSNLEGRFEGCLGAESDFVIEAEKEGFDPGDIKISTRGLDRHLSVMAELRLHPNSGNVFNQPIEEGTVIVLRNIYYDFNKSAIRQGDSSELMALAKLMKLYPSMEIELAAHTDSRGEADYNLDLSMRRAESAKAFLVTQDINEQRIATIGFGETRISNHCLDGVSCSDEEHQYNRRTEVRVLHIDESVTLDQSNTAPGGRRKKN